MKIIRNKSAGISKPISTSNQQQIKPITASSNFLTEQAIRASVRQAVLNMNLTLEAASKHEIQFLKHIGVLGKRAPSCSLLDGYDMALLLDAFGRTYASSELRNVVNSITNLHNYESLTPAMLDDNSSNDTYNNTINHNNNKNTNDLSSSSNESSSPLPELKRQLIRKRKLQRLLSDNSKSASGTVTKRAYNRKRTQSEPVIESADNNQNDELSDSSSTGSGSSNGLDTLLSALSTPTNHTIPTAIPVTLPLHANTFNQNNISNGVQSSPTNAIAQRPLLSRHYSGNLNLTLSPPTSALPLLPQFAGVAYYNNNANNTAQYSSLASPVANNLTGSAAVPAQTYSAPSFAPTRSVDQQQGNKSSTINVLNSDVNRPPQTNENYASISPSASYDEFIVSNTRSQYISNTQPLMSTEIEQY